MDRRHQAAITLCIGLLVFLSACRNDPTDDPCFYEIAFDAERDGRTEVYVLDIETRDVRQVTHHDVLALANRLPDWAPGGGELVFVSQDTTGLGNLFTIRVDGTGLRQLTSDTAYYHNPAWSPNGDWIAVERGDASGAWELHLIRADGAEAVKVAEQVYHPAWSPASDRLAVVAESQEAYVGVIMQVDGTVERVAVDLAVQPGEGLGSIKWSPDGGRLAFDAVRGANFDLYVVGADGSNLRRLTTSPAVDARPEWSPTGDRLVFHTTRDFGSVVGSERWEEFELYLMELETGELVRLPENDLFDAHPDWCTR